MALKIEDLPDDAALLKAMILAQRTEADVMRADAARLDAERARLVCEQDALSAEVDRLNRQNERLDHIIAVLRRAQFGRSSERISDDQLNLALEDVETGNGVENATAEGQRHRQARRRQWPARQPWQAAGTSAARGDRHRA